MDGRACAVMSATACSVCWSVPCARLLCIAMMRRLHGKPNGPRDEWVAIGGFCIPYGSVYPLKACRACMYGSGFLYFYFESFVY